MKQDALRSIAFTIVCIILGVLIALQMKNVNLSNLSAANLTELQDKLLEYMSKNAELSSRNASLNEYISLLENDMASGNEQIDAIIMEKERAAIFAGLREVRNYGIVITISCAKEVDIRDSVLREFVNELRTLGAQAIAINDERLVATSEIRGSGTAIIINGVAFNRQGVFEIKAITDPLKESSIIDSLEIVRDSIQNNTQIANDQYDIQLNPLPELTIPPLSEDSLAFKIDLLMPKE